MASELVQVHVMVSTVHGIVVVDAKAGTDIVIRKQDVAHAYPGGDGFVIVFDNGRVQGNLNCTGDLSQLV